MRKEAVGIPIVLWICAAAWFHTMIGGGGYELAVLHDDGNELSSFSAKVRDRVRDSEQVTEYDIDDGSPSPAPPDEEAPPPEAVKPPKPEQKKPDEAKKPEAKKPEEPKKEDKKIPVPVTPAQPTPPPEPKKDQRIAVRQHVRPDQEDNKSAQHIADEANTVAEEKVATQTSQDEDDEHPAPGGNHAGPNDEVGNAEKTKIANSEEHAGEKNRAPGEKGTVFDIEKPAHPKNSPTDKTASTPPPAGGDGRTAATPAKAPKVEQPTPAPPAGVDVPDSPKGGWSFNPFRGPAKQGAETDKSAEGQTGRKVEAPNNPSTTKWLGLGGTPGPGQINLNLSHQSVVASIGEDKLRKERMADGERRLTAHRGSWRSSNFDRWRSAIENYVTSVKPGNQTSLNAARVPFATYLNGIHNRIHPIFAESFLDSLSGLPANHPLNNKNMHTNLEIVLTKDGKIVKMGITRTSGVTAFDIAALDSVERASPFGPAPGAILSTDGNVYLHWEFHRDEVFACSTMNARPFMLNVPGSKPETPEMPPAGPKPTEGAPPTGARHGLLRGPGAKSY